MRARSKHAPLDFGSAWTSSASIAADGSCPPRSCRNVGSITSLAIAFFIAGKRSPRTTPSSFARGLATEQQVSGTQARAAGCAERRGVTFDASSPVAG
jgi:hypothetical protein